MKYIVDHDMHMHSHYSPCSSDARQTPEALLAYGVTSGFKLISLSDHSWDRAVHCDTPGCWGPLSDVMKLLPLPQSKACRFLFGMEVDMNYHDVLGVSSEMMEKLDFMVISVSHLNLKGFSLDPAVTGEDAVAHKVRYLERLHAMLNMDLPFYKTTLAHFTTGNVCNTDLLGCLSLISDAELTDIFTKVRDRGMGVELNFRVSQLNDSNRDILLRPYFIAKNLGCKFTLGGDAHHPEGFCGNRQNMEKIVDLLELSEDDKLPYVREMIATLGEDRPTLGRDGIKA